SAGQLARPLRRLVWSGPGGVQVDQPTDSSHPLTGEAFYGRIVWPDESSMPSEEQPLPGGKVPPTAEPGTPDAGQCLPFAPNFALTRQQMFRLGKLRLHRLDGSHPLAEVKEQDASLGGGLWHKPFGLGRHFTGWRFQIIENRNRPLQMGYRL